MLDAWIVEETLKEKRREAERPRLELPLVIEEPKEEDEEPEGNRGVTTIQIWGDEDEEEQAT